MGQHPSYQPMKEPKILTVEALPDFALRITWANGLTSNISQKEAIFDADKPALKPLQDTSVFAGVSCEFGWSVEWESVDIQIGADMLWMDYLSQSGKPGAARFFLFRLQNSLSLSGAAEVFDMSRRMMAAYSSGAKPLPRTMILAMKGYEAEKRGLIGLGFAKYMTGKLAATGAINDGNTNRSRVHTGVFGGDQTVREEAVLADAARK